MEIENKTEILVTVISIYYNRENYIYESIKSLLNQTLKNFNIIIVDDCSTDNTYQKILKTVDNSPYVKVLKNQMNKGFTKTLIETISTVNTKYVAIHGAGDISHPERLEYQLSYLENNKDVGLVTCDVSNIKRSKFYKTNITSDDLLIKNRITHGSVMFRLDIYHEAGGYRDFFTTRQDKDLWFRMSTITKLHFLNSKLYTEKQVENSVSKSASITGLPLLLSEFAKYLHIIRLKTGIDLLDKYGAYSALYFQPSRANYLFYRMILSNLKKKRWDSISNAFDILILINKRHFRVFIFYIFKFMIVFFKYFSPKK